MSKAKAKRTTKRRGPMTEAELRRQMRRIAQKYGIRLSKKSEDECVKILKKYRAAHWAGLRRIEKGGAA